MVDGLDDRLVSLVTPTSFEAEQYRALRHIIEQLRTTSNHHVLAVSSAGPGDGKTTTAINIAGALAQASEARVLLIDADLRRPALGQRLGIREMAGANLVDAIDDGGETLTRMVHDLPGVKLSVICAGPAPPRPYEIFASPGFGELLEEARRRYDYIILDTPPLIPVQDCRVISRWVDGFLLVVAAHRTQRQLLEEALTTLEPAKILGVVFNGDDRSSARRKSGYYRRCSAKREA